MADVKLGPSGSEQILPSVKFIGSPPSLTVSSDKQVDEQTMSDGSKRWNFRLIKREWKLSWGYLTKTQLDQLINLYALNQVLRFQNNNEDATWYDVVMVPPFAYEPVRTDIRSLERYTCEITLRQA